MEEKRITGDKNRTESEPERDAKKRGERYLRAMFSEVFKKHTAEDAEMYFAAGTPILKRCGEDDAPDYPKPWFFSRVLGISLVSFLGFFAGSFIFLNPNFLPGLIFFGSFITPISILIFFWEINIARDISIYRMTMILLQGSIVALLYTVIIYSIFDGKSSPLMIGFVEETAKVLTLFLLIRKKYKYILNGMLIGAAIGTGFAAFESAGYILMTALKYGIAPMVQTIFWRAVFAPGVHIAWAGLTGAALLAVKGKRTLRFTMLFNVRFLWVYVLVIVLHALWDTPIPQPASIGIPVYPMLLTLVSWMLLFLFIHRGVKQVMNTPEENEAEKNETVDDNAARDRLDGVNVISKSPAKDLEANRNAENMAVENNTDEDAETGNPVKNDLPASSDDPDR